MRDMNLEDKTIAYKRYYPPACIPLPKKKNRVNKTKTKIALSPPTTEESNIKAIR